MGHAFGYRQAATLPTLRNSWKVVEQHAEMLAMFLSCITIIS